MTISAAVPNSSGLDGSGTPEVLTGSTVGAMILIAVWVGSVPDGIVSALLPRVGRSISRKASNPFGLVVGIGEKVLSKIANVNVSGATVSTFVVASISKLS